MIIFAALVLAGALRATPGEAGGDLREILAGGIASGAKKIVVGEIPPAEK